MRFHLFAVCVAMLTSLLPLIAGVPCDEMLRFESHVMG